MVQSVRLSVCHTFLTMLMFPSSYHHEIFRSYYQWQKWCPCKRSRPKVKVIEVMTQIGRFRTVTPVWNHIWWWNDACSLMLLRRGALLFSRSSVKYQGHTALKIVEFDPDWTFPDCNSSFNSPMATKWCTELEVALKRCPIVFSCDQAALWMVQSVCPSVTPFWLCSHHHIIMKFSGVITSDKSDVHAKGQGQRSKVTVTEVMTPFSRFRTVTPVWIHILRWNDAYSLMLLRRGALLFFKVIRQISRSHH